MYYNRPGCPNCGYCQHCGRGATPYHPPYHPGGIAPNTPDWTWRPEYQPRYQTTTGTIIDADQWQKIMKLHSKIVHASPPIN